MQFALKILCSDFENLSAVLQAISTVEGVEMEPVAQPSPAPIAAVAETPVTPQPAMTQPVTQQTSVALEFDDSGLPWDERIHAKTKGKTKDGNWRNKKGIDKGVLAQVEAELRAKHANGATPEPAVTQSVTQQPAPPTPVNATPSPMPAGDNAQPAVTQPAPVQPAMQQPTPVQPAVTQPVTPQPATTQFDLMQHLSTKMNERDASGMPVIDAAYMQQITNETSTAFQCNPPLKAITDAAQNPQMVDYIKQLLVRDGKW